MITVNEFNNLILKRTDDKIYSEHPFLQTVGISNISLIEGNIATIFRYCILYTASELLSIQMSMLVSRGAYSCIN